ncbi:MAG TPA: CPBP family intramembrane glutamic endopeptidase [Chloroflexota bacterium]|nr:CPBP family intramembrane glutamic endopeptidase [Chloroflexota bacterium]
MASAIGLWHMDEHSPDRSVTDELINDPAAVGWPEIPWGAGAALGIAAVCVVGALVLLLPIAFVLGEQVAMAAPAGEILMIFMLWWVVGTLYGHDGYDALLEPGGVTATRPRKALLLGGAAAIVVYLLEFAVVTVVEAVGGPLPALQEHVVELLMAGPVIGTLTVVTVVFFAPLAEELFFRGLLFQGLQRRWSWWPAAVASSLLFAVLHAEPTVVGTALVVPLGVVFGVVSCWLLTRTRTLLSSVALHSVVNAAYTITLFVDPPS